MYAADYYRITGTAGRAPVYPFTPGIEGVQGGHNRLRLPATLQMGWS